MADISVLNTTADLSGKTIVTAEGDRTITGLLTYSRGAAAVPFAVAASAAMVSNLDADKLHGHDDTYFTNASNLGSGTVPAARLGDGSNLTSLNASQLTSGTIPAARVPTVLTTTSTGTQNDFAPGTFSGVVVVLRCNNASLLTINGIAGGVDGQRLIIESIGAGQVDLAHQAAGSTAANRLINFATSGNTSLAAGVGTAEFIYDATTARWRLVQHEQGAWITRTFAAGNYTASAGTWTVASASIDAYWLKGRTLTYAWTVSGTTSTTPVTIKILVPGGFSAVTTTPGTHYMGNVGDGTSAVGYYQLNTTQLQMQRSGNTAFVAGTVSTFGTASFEIQ